MEKRIGRLVLGMLASAAALSFGPGARVDLSAPPNLQGQPAVHAWSVPGVINPADLSTFFACTNTLGSTVTIGVEIFGPTGGVALNDASATSLAVALGGTVLFGTTLALGFSADTNLGPGFVHKGSARVLTTTSSKASQQILCSASLPTPATLLRPA